MHNWMQEWKEIGETGQHWYSYLMDPPVAEIFVSSTSVYERKNVWVLLSFGNQEMHLHKQDTWEGIRRGGPLGDLGKVPWPLMASGLFLCSVLIELCNCGIRITTELIFSPSICVHLNPGRMCSVCVLRVCVCVCLYIVVGYFPPSCWLQSWKIQTAVASRFNKPKSLCPCSVGEVFSPLKPRLPLIICLAYATVIISPAFSKPFFKL